MFEATPLVIQKGDVPTTYGRNNRPDLYWAKIFLSSRWVNEELGELKRGVINFLEISENPYVKSEISYANC